MARRPSMAAAAPSGSPALPVSEPAPRVRNSPSAATSSRRSRRRDEGGEPVFIFPHPALDGQIRRQASDINSARPKPFGRAALVWVGFTKILSVRAFFVAAMPHPMRMWKLRTRKLCLDLTRPRLCCAIGFAEATLSDRAPGNRDSLALVLKGAAGWAGGARWSFLSDEPRSTLGR